MTAPVPIRLLVALALATVLFGLYLRLSGAPTRVHVAEGLGLFALFVVPALFVGSVADLKKKWIVLLVLILIGVVVRDYLVSAQVAKADFAMYALISYPMLVLGVAGLLFLHAVLAQYLARKGLYNPAL